MSKVKREFDRHSGSGQPIKEKAKRGGAGAGNWGDDTEQIHDAVTKHTEEEAAAAVVAPATSGDNKEAKKDDLDPQNYGDLATTEPKAVDLSYEEYVKQNKDKAGKKAYDQRTVTNRALTADRYKGKNEYERATDELLSGAQKEKKKRKKSKKQQKVIQPQYSFLPASGRPERREFDRPGRGRGDGERGGYGGFSRGGGRGFSDNRGGFGSRGRGRRNDSSVEFDNRSGVPQPHRPQPQYRLKSGDANNAGVNAPTQQHEQSREVPQPTA